MNDTHTPPLRRWLRRLSPLLVIAIAVAGTVVMMKTAPKTQRQVPPPQPRLVEVEPVQSGRHATTVSVMGTVLAAQKSSLSPQVNGVVLEMSPQLVPGGIFRQGETLLRLDEADLRLALQQKEAALAQAEATLAEEQGQQRVARREFELLGQAIAPEDEALVLRQPKLAAAQAALSTARATLDQARLDLQRARIAAPFSGMVASRQVDVGSRVTTTTPLLTLLSTDEFWLQVSVPLEQLQWIAVPDTPDGNGSAVRIHNDSAWPAGAQRSGHVMRLLPELDGQARMAQLLIRITDPMALRPANRGQPPILINDYLRVEIEGRPVDNAVRLRRELLREGDRVWLIKDDNTLEIRPVHVAFRGRDSVLVDQGLAAGERVINSTIGTPVAGMSLRTAAEGAPQRPSRPDGGSGKPAAR